MVKQIHTRSLMLALGLVSGFALFGTAFGDQGPKDDFSRVVNLKKFLKDEPLTERERALLKKNGFEVYETEHDSIASIYGANVYTEIPSLITADCFLDTVHMVYESAIRAAENQALHTKLSRLVTKMGAASLVRLKTAPSEDALREAAYLFVGERVLGGQTPLPNDLAAIVRAELKAIYAHHDKQSSPVAQKDLDYTQFIPRGHYARTRELSQYFRAMMWFGLVPIDLANEDGSLNASGLQVAKYLVEDLKASGATYDWNEIADFLDAFFGHANALTLKEFDAAKGDVTRLRRAELTQHVHGKYSSDLQIRLFPQRAIPDSVAFSKLTKPFARAFPDPLDIPAVMGSARAAEILDGNPSLYNPDGWPDYPAIRATLTKEWAQKSFSEKDDLYQGYLGLMREFLKPAATGAARFYQAPAYRDLQLNTVLGSWAQLRHDSILYGEQQVAEMGDGEEDQAKLVKGYVEPRPEFYRRCAAWAEQLMRKLPTLEKGKRDWPSDQVKNFIKLANFAERVSNLELQHTALKQADYEKIWTFETDIAGIEGDLKEYGNTYELLSEDDRDPAVVADVHTGGDQALEVGTGRYDVIVAIVPVEGKLYLARGSVLSFYQTKVPTSERITDHAWKEMARNGKLPKRPDWIKSYFISDRPLMRA